MSQEQKKVVSIQIVPFKVVRKMLARQEVQIQPEGADRDTCGYAVYQCFEDGTTAHVCDRKYEVESIEIVKTLCKELQVPIEPYPWQDTVPVNFTPNLEERGYAPPNSLELGLLALEDVLSRSNLPVSNEEVQYACESNVVFTDKPSVTEDGMLKSEDYNYCNDIEEPDANSGGNAAPAVPDVPSEPEDRSSSQDDQ